MNVAVRERLRDFCVCGENWMGDGMKEISDTGLVQDEPLIFERGSKGRRGYSLPRWDVEEVEPDKLVPSHLLRGELEGFPQVSEIDVVRHFTRLSQWNYGVDSGLYPLGSCTMKYNPKVNEEVVRMTGFSLAHPYQPEGLSQGILKLMHDLEEFPCGDHGNGPCDPSTCCRGPR